MQNSGSTLLSLKMKALSSKIRICQLPPIKINIPQSTPNFDHLEVPQSEEEVLAEIDKETKEKVDLKQIKGTAFT